MTSLYFYDHKFYLYKFSLSLCGVFPKMNQTISEQPRILIYMRLGLLIKLTIFFSLMMMGLTAQNITRTALNEAWRFQSAVELQANQDDLGQNIRSDWYPTRLPNTVLNALLEQKLIEDPFFGKNEARLQWLEKKDWIFEKNFDVSPQTLSASHINLILRGVDTYADVYLNDALVLKTDNLFRTWQVDIKNYLRPKNNILRLYFTSPLTKERVAVDNSFTDFPAIPENTRMFTRKAGFHYGWDWGPRLITCGLQDVEIQTWNDLVLEDVFLKHISISTDKATLQAQVRINTQKDGNVTATVQFGDRTFIQKAAVTTGQNIVYVNIEIPNPILWWTHNLGTPHLYTVKTSVNTEGGQTESKTMKHGLRTIELVQQKDEKGETFFFRLNGIPIFAKGANMIPLHFFQEKINREDIERTINNALGANMNMLRIWGGGVYQANTFYELCDEKGLLIWHDFMYACAMYPNEEKFMETAREEAIEQVQRLRNYACLALWCGNNEINEAWHNWGWQPRYNPDQKESIWNAYKDIFQKMLPNIVREHANNTAYHESSPRFGRYNNKSYTEADNHDWFVWHDEKPFEHFEEKIPRFASEYGFQSFPEWTTIESFTRPQDRNLETDVMLAHQKHPKGNALMRKYMDREYRKPKSFKEFTYVSQIVQAEGIRKAIEAQRRAMPYCMGSLYWQLNDVWPVASWSSIDSHNKWKALHYYAKEAYANVIVSPVVTKDSLKIHVVNDLLTNFEGELFVQVMDFSGRTFFMDGRYVYINGNSASIAYRNTLSNILQNENPRQTVILINFRPKNGNSVVRTHYLVPPKELDLEKNIVVYKEVTPAKDGYNIRIRTPKLLKNAFLRTPAQGWFSHNYFDMVPGQTYDVFFKSTAPLSELFNSLEITSLVDTY
jgi:beta-mannosidase